MTTNDHGSLLNALAGILGAANVLTDADDLRFHAQDVYREGLIPIAVIRPASTEELSAALKAIAPFGLPVVPRGGGMSYTDGYLPSRPHSITVDMLRMANVVNIAPDDRYVTVECGATWQALYSALQPKGVRTPYWGPLSGLRSSIGGALSQGSMFLGSGRHGAVADSVIGLDVVLVDGTVLHLGSHSNGRGAPFFRNFGPDLMAMFLSDNGALGIKTRATFRLVRAETENRHLSYEFADAESVLEAMSAISREEIVSECFAFDPGLQAVRLKRARLTDDVKTLGKVMKAAGGGLAGLKEGAKLVMAGRSFLEAGTYSLHLSFDGRDARDADSKLDLARQTIGKLGREVDNSIPKVMRANPFAEVNSMLGPGGERWVPVHGIVPFTQARRVFDSCNAVFERFAAERKQFDIDHGYLLATVGTVGLVIEPVLYWPDSRQMFHERVLAKDYLASLQNFPPNPEASAAVARLREALAVNFMELGSAHFQIGKFYRFQEGLEPSAREFLARIKTLVDPDGRMNPGSLGLAKG